MKPLAPMELHREVCSGQRLRVLLEVVDAAARRRPMDVIGTESIPRWWKYRQAVLEM